MKAAILPLLIVFLCAGLSACASEDETLPATPSVEPAGVASYEGRGVVLTITPSKNFVNIDHEAIPDFMDAMAMMFAVKDSSVIEGVAAGDSIVFKLEVGSSMPQIVEVEIIR